MIVYSATKGRFQQDVMTNGIGDIIYDAYNPNTAGHGRVPRSSGSRAKRYARQAREGVCRPERAHAMRGVSFSRNLPADRKQGGDRHARLFSILQVYETALAQAEKASAGQKHVLIVEGGPGTGKTVVAVNLLVSLTKRELMAQYVTRNSAPRLVYEAKLTGSLKKSRITNLFSGSGAYHAAQPNTYDCLIVDEAHRLIPNSACGITREAGGGPSAMRARPDGVYASRRAPAMRAENFIRSFQANAKSGMFRHLKEQETVCAVPAEEG